MKEVVYILIMTLTYPIWKLSLLLMDVIFAAHKKLIKWVENKN